MAGVGFALKKVFRGGDSVLGALRGYSLTAVVTEGPMVLMIVLLLTLRALMARDGAVYRTREEFLFLMTYVMIFSLILSNTVLLFVNRFISDCIYQERLQDVLPAFFGVVFFLLAAGAPAALLYLLTLPVDWAVRGAVLTLFCVLLILWIQIAFLSAIKRYEYVLLGFVAGVAGALGLAALLLGLGVAPLPGALWGAALGFTLMLFLYMAQLLAHYPPGRWDLLVFFPALERYRVLVATGLCLALGLYTHNFVFWASAYRDKIYPTGVFCTRYDVPCFFATLTILPMLVQFVVGLETRFEVKNRAYFDAVLYGGRLEEIRAAKQELCTVLYTELAHMMEVQLIVTVAAVTFVGNFLQTVGLDERMAGTYRLLCCGYCLYGFVKCGTVILLYFDDRRGALRASALFLGLSTALSLATLPLDSGWWGIGFLLAGAATALYLMLRIRRYLNELEYHVFCEQPLFAQPQQGVLSRIQERFAGAERESAQRRTLREEDDQ
ncbi:MAG TPA: exopolysaccharide Pel transporter PelG [Candidatus Gemmiger excrementavium]|uniref:Exopolysaccharide Pel transporter PelG n=1 Tax=Candidatus Gemmiger excrementavium TaxID=2838608 RepID=A0A9D2F105_9FIRM|nr:exopolysaccharide Pel transporter PelG [Candidatus Gemmiger excrementavium]